MHVLITSPIPTHPQDHGNRSRTHAIARALQQRGHKVHFLYAGLYPLREDQELAMRRAWDFVHVLPPPENPPPMTGRRHYRIDDWHREAISDAAARICTIWSIGAAIANYVWCSGWLNAIPAGIPKLIDTHDVFGDRHKTLKRDGMSPSWFYTTPREEGIGLDRADLVLAIQEVEAATLSARTRTPVRVLGHLAEPAFLPFRPPGERLKVGYVSSDNPVNQNALTRLSKAFSRAGDLQNRVSLHLAGALGATAAAEASPFEARGFVPDVAAFYDEMDLIINPTFGGTGLKIKCVEALGYGKALLATADSMTGIASDHPCHQATNLKEFLDYLGQLAGNAGALEMLAEQGRAVFTAYEATQQTMLDRLFPTGAEKAMLADTGDVTHEEEAP
ncbi:glycosyltransferase [Yunchengibacter salinarum]|uniref:glycosyltransferase n=1 Tax=Yunchengibacter salinarum TaxID=3133399 RepID=UPI0035B65F05